MISLVLLSLFNFETPSLTDAAVDAVVEATVLAEGEADEGMRYPGIEALFAKFELEL